MPQCIVSRFARHSSTDVNTFAGHNFDASLLLTSASPDSTATSGCYDIAEYAIRRSPLAAKCSPHETKFAISDFIAFDRRAYRYRSSLCVLAMG
jgi:hypothetical protein